MLLNMHYDKYFILLALVTTVIMIVIQQVISTDMGRNMNFKEIAKDKALANHTVRTIRSIMDFDECIQQCYVDLRCFTVNLCTKSDGSLSCNLLNSDHVRSKDDLVDKRGCTHFGSETACSSSPCKNNATCQGNFAHGPIYRCLCPEGYTGLVCEIAIDKCESGAHDCHANATCTRTTSSAGGYQCTCKHGFTGDGMKCTDIDDCSSNPCVHGSCNDLTNDYSCKCEAGWIGKNCDKDFDDCNPNHCQNEGVCKDKVGGFQCTCAPGFSGGNCETIAGTCSELKSTLTSDQLLQNELFPLPSKPNVPYSVFCSFANFSCGEGTWNLAMKIDGAKQTFEYKAKNLWEDHKEFKPEASKTGLDNQETKTSAFNNTRLTKLCLGMKYDGNTTWLGIVKNALSLREVMEDGEKLIELGEAKWKDWLPGSSLQQRCQKEGFNIDGGDDRGKRNLRIGIMSSGQNNCGYYESFIGIGAKMEHLHERGVINCGNYAPSDSYHGKTRIKGFCYVLVRS